MTLKFEDYFETLCKKVSQKVNVLARISSHMILKRWKFIFTCFIISHFSHSPIVWMFHSQRLNNRTNNTHKRALMIIYQDYAAALIDLLEENNSLKIHQRNFQKLVTEMFKVKIGIAPEIIPN